MTLTKKTCIAVIVLITVFIALLLLISKFIILESFSKLEEQSMGMDIKRVIGALNRDLEDLNGICLEYSMWDDTYKFITDRNEEYIASNFADITTLSKFRINFELFIANNGRIVYSIGYDDEQQRRTEVSDTLIKQLLGTSTVSYHKSPDSSIAGFINTVHGPAMIVSQPIVTSTGDGPVRGTLIMGRYLTPAEMLRLTNVTHINTRIFTYDKRRMTIDMEEASTQLTQDNPFMVKALNSYTIAGYALIDDVFGNPGLILKIDSRRRIYNQGEASIYYFAWLLILAGIVFITVIIILLKRIVLNRVSSLSDTTYSIAASGDLSLRMKNSGKDELSKLIYSINYMLDRLQNAQSELSESEFKFRSLFENMQEGFTYNEIILDNEGKAVDFIVHEANDAFLQQFEIKIEKSEILGKHISILNQYLYSSIVDLINVFGNAALNGQRSKIEEIYLEYFNKWYSISAYSSKKGYFAAIFSDISEVKEAEHKMHYLAHYDSLTNLPNRKLFFDELEAVLACCKSSNSMFAVLFIDLNNFKKVNDKFGHDAGDNLLNEVANRLAEIVRNDDIAARLGGDEFIIIQKHIKKREDSEKLAVRIIDSIRFTYEADDGVIEVDASVGISIYPHDSDNIQSLVRKADMAMYSAKYSQDSSKLRFHKKND